MVIRVNYPLHLSYAIIFHNWLLRQGNGGIMGLTSEFLPENAVIRSIFIKPPGTDLGHDAQAGYFTIDSPGYPVVPFYTAIGGTITAINDEVVAEPGIWQKDPYRKGWLFHIRPFNSPDMAYMISAQEYAQWNDPGWTPAVKIIDYDYGLTDEEKNRLKKIADQIQLYFEDHPEKQQLSLGDAQEILAEAQLAERDPDDPHHLLQFLETVTPKSGLAYLPQHRQVPEEGRWHRYFQSIPSVVISCDIPAPEAGLTPAMVREKLELISREIAGLPKRPAGDFDAIQLKARGEHPRAYEFWSPKEEDLLLEAVKITLILHKIAGVFGRPRRTMSYKLKQLVKSGRQPRKG